MATQIYASITADNVGDFKKQLADLYQAHFPEPFVLPKAPLVAGTAVTIDELREIVESGGHTVPTDSQDTPLPLPAAPEPTQAPKKRGRKSNAEKAAEAAAAAHQANPEPVTAPLACSHYRANPSDDCPQCNLAEPAVPVAAEDPMPQEKPGEDLFPIPDFLKREQPVRSEQPAKPDAQAPAPTDRNVGFAPRDHARDCMKQLMDTKGLPVVIAALAQFGAKRISELAEDKIAAFCEHVSGLLNPKVA